ncbi:hypothetical protein DIPPA_33237 [Diplonema papillatum]|nr:hypothetical protein DIPPA_33237 [Diplonema papillatum]
MVLVTAPGAKFSEVRSGEIPQTIDVTSLLMSEKVSAVLNSSCASTAHTSEAAFPESEDDGDGLIFTSASTADLACDYSNGSDEVGHCLSI